MKCCYFCWVNANDRSKCFLCQRIFNINNPPQNRKSFLKENKHKIQFWHIVLSGITAAYIDNYIPASRKNPLLFLAYSFYVSILVITEKYI